jgi:hypothetical protein
MAAIEIPVYINDREALVDLADPRLPYPHADPVASLFRLREAGFINPDNSLTPKGEAALPHCRRKQDTCPFSGKAR